MNNNSTPVNKNNNSMFLNNNKAPTPIVAAQESWWRVGMKDKKVMAGLVATAMFFVYKTLFQSPQIEEPSFSDIFFSKQPQPEDSNFLIQAIKVGCTLGIIYVLSSKVQSIFPSNSPVVQPLINNKSPVNASLQPTTQVSSQPIEVEAYVDIEKYANAFVYGNPDEDVSHFYYHRIPYLIDDKYAYESIFGDLKPTSFSSFNIHEEKKLPPCKKLTLADGSAIPLIEGDFLIPIVIKGSSNPLECDSCIYLPSFFVRGFKGESVSLKYGDQLINLSLKDFDPEFKGTQWENLTNDDLLKSMEVDLYQMRDAHASHPISLKNTSVPFETLKKNLKRYLPPSEVLKKQGQTQLQANTLQSICKIERNALKAIPIEVYFPIPKLTEDGKISLKAEGPLVTLKYDDHAVFDLEEKMKEFAGKEIEVHRLGTNGMYSPRIDNNGLGIYINPRYTKNSCLLISDKDLVLWQEHKSKKEIEEDNNVKLDKYERPDVTITYVPISAIGKDIIERVIKGKFLNGLFYIPLGKIVKKKENLSSTEIEKEVLDFGSDKLAIK